MKRFGHLTVVLPLVLIVVAVVPGGAQAPAPAQKPALLNQ